MYYLDPSAFLKLLLVEEHGEAARAWFEAGPDCWSSQLLVTEAGLAGRRHGVANEALRQALDTVSLVLPGASTFRIAADMAHGNLRSLDALHLATAVELGADLEAVVTYDQRMTVGALALGMEVITPR